MLSLEQLTKRTKTKQNLVNQVGYTGMRHVRRSYYNDRVRGQLSHCMMAVRRSHQMARIHANIFHTVMGSSRDNMHYTQRTIYPIK